MPKDQWRNATLRSRRGRYHPGGAGPTGPVAAPLREPKQKPPRCTACGNCARRGHTLCRPCTQSNGTTSKVSEPVAVTGMMVAIHFDGACWPNPGGRAGYGWQAYEETLDGPQPLGEWFGNVAQPTSNNVAEWTALVRALEWVATRQDIGYLTIRGDSKLVINQLAGRYKCNAQHLAPFLAKSLKMLNRFRKRWHSEWVPRERNVAADELSNRGMASTRSC
jgi:ribonuclease HI